MKGWFVTGTDTEIGKTRAAVALVQALRAAGHRPAAMKPVASGCEVVDGALRNDDALDLIRASGRSLPYEAVNPYAFQEAVAPHLAAADEGVTIDLERVLRAARMLRAGAETLVVEGVGGWAVPLGPGTYLVDLVRALDLPVVLVVGVRLGCLNHAILSARQIEADGCRLVGWVGSILDPEQAKQEQNLETLRNTLAVPCIGMLPWDPQPDPETLGSCIDLDRLLEST